MRHVTLQRLIQIQIPNVREPAALVQHAHVRADVRGVGSEGPKVRVALDVVLRFHEADE